MNIALRKPFGTRAGADGIRSFSGQQRVVPSYEVNTQQLLLEVSGKGVSSELQDAGLRALCLKP